MAKTVHIKPVIKWACFENLGQCKRTCQILVKSSNRQPVGLNLHKQANVSDTEVSFLDLLSSISDGLVKTKILDKRDDFDFDIVNFPFLDGDVPRSTSYGVYISQLRFARVSSHVDDSNTRKTVLTAKLLRQGYRYHKLRMAFSKFYWRHFDALLAWFNWWVSFAPEFLCCYFCESSCLFYLSFNFDFYVSKIMHL